jgi:poly(A) polymerase
MIRHDNVFGTAGEDARRRDFTINGLFFDLKSGELIDYVGGLRDLERGVIETIGDPWLRFREDPVRLLRAIKFAGRLGFRLADDVYQAMLDCRDDLSKAAAPRIHEEIIRLINRGGAEQSIRLLFKSGIMELLLPEVAADMERGLTDPGGPPVLGYARAVDHMVRRGRDVDHVVMLACLFLNIFDDALYGEGAGNGVRDLNALIEQTLHPVSTRLHMSRRDIYRLKQILMAQRRFTNQGQGKRRRGSSAQLMTRDYFRDAWELFRLHGETRGRFAEEIAEWGQRTRRG